MSKIIAWYLPSGHQTWQLEIVITEVSSWENHLIWDPNVCGGGFLKFKLNHPKSDYFSIETHGFGVPGRVPFFCLGYIYI